MHIFNEARCSYSIPSKIFTKVMHISKKMKSDEKNSSYHPDTNGGRTDGQTDRRTDRQGESPPQLILFYEWPWQDCFMMFGLSVCFSLKWKCNLMKRIQVIIRTLMADGRTDGWTEGRTDRVNPPLNLSYFLSGLGKTVSFCLGSRCASHWNENVIWWK